jgi:hypothetical protein
MKMKQTDTHTHTHKKKSDGFLLLLQREKNFCVFVVHVCTYSYTWVYLLCVSGLCERVQEKVGPPRGVGRWETQGKNVARALCCWLCWEPTRWLPPRATQFQLVCTPCTGKCFIISDPQIVSKNPPKFDLKNKKTNKREMGERKCRFYFIRKRIRKSIFLRNGEKCGMMSFTPSKGGHPKKCVIDWWHSI